MSKLPVCWSSQEIQPRLDRRVRVLRRVVTVIAKRIVQKCPFANLPEEKSGRWGQGLTAAKMKECIWVKPELVANFEFLEWTDSNHVRHIKFVSLRDDKDPHMVLRE
jgi:ATP-dependent DNA ligase